MEKRRTLIVWTVLVAALTLACACPVIAETQKRLEAVATVNSGISTVGAIVTQLPAEELMKTASAGLTQMPAESLLTQMPDGLMETAQAGGLPIPEGLPGIPGLTGSSTGNEQAPGDIPLLPEPRQNFIGSNEFVSYITNKTFDEAVAFYKSEMPAQAWEEGTGSVEGSGSALLIYNKADRSATVSIRVEDGKTIVQVTIVPK